MICELAGDQKASVMKSSRIVVERKKSKKHKLQSSMVTILLGLYLRVYLKNRWLGKIT